MDMGETDKDSLDALKQLLILPEKERIQTIEDRLDDPMKRAREVSQLLPEAISMSVLSNNKISRVLHPVIDDTLKASVKKNPKAIADAIFPALGPGIRKAISATILGMIQSLNQVLNHSFSIQGLKWRFEAFKTRKSFAEVVLLNTLVFQVEQIFLIHERTGIVLEHVVAKDAIVQDPDLVSGMLTAIQDFVQDSFQTETGDGLDTLRIGSSRSVWIEKGEDALIAAVIRGTPPMDLRTFFREQIEEIHLKAGTALKEFDGDPVPFAVFRESLEEGLTSMEKQESQKVSPLLWVLVLILFLLAGLAGFHMFSRHQQRQLAVLERQHVLHTFEAIRNRMEATKGLILTSVRERNGEFRIQGLRDPLAPDPAGLITAQERSQLRINAQWRAFYSLDPGLVILRARRFLAPPDTVRLKLSGDTLMAAGKASHNWIQASRRLALAVPGVNGYRDDGIQNTDRLALDRSLAELNRIRFFFENNRTELVPGQEPVLETALETVRSIQAGQSLLQVPVQIRIRGHTDSSGNEKRNLKLSLERARTLFDLLVANGIRADLLSVSGVGNTLPLAAESDREGREINRAVSFNATIVPKGNPQ